MISTNACSSRPRTALSRVLLGSVAILAVGGAAATVALAEGAPSQAAQPAPASIAPGSFADVVARVSPAVVSVKVKVTEDQADADQDGVPDRQRGTLDGQQNGPMGRFFQRFGEMNAPAQQHPRVGMALGSGFFISKDGYAVTNDHVVEHATNVELTLQDGRSVPATVVGTDKKTDLALLKAKTGDDYPFVTWGPNNPRVGDWVVAVGNPFGLGGTVTAGIVSARGRDIGAGPYDDFLQIDAPVNKGNSGGPTFNTQGQVVGVNTAIFSPSGGSVGIGFAIPAEVAQDVVAQLKDHGVVARGWLGLQVQPVSTDIADSLGLKTTRGALVSDPQKGSPAADAGVKAGDVVEAVNGAAVSDPRALSRSIAALGPDKKGTLMVWRDGADTTIPVTLGTLPGERQAAMADPARQERAELSSLGMRLVPSLMVPGGTGDGVVVAGLDPDGAAARHGISPGDVILQANGRPVSRPADVASAFSAAKLDGKPVLLRMRTAKGIRFLALASSIG